MKGFAALMSLQHTIAQAGSIAGAGVHTGKQARVRFLPAPANSGIVFYRTDVTGRDRTIPVSVDLVASSANGTNLKNAAGVEVATVEHFLAACAGLEIDNIAVEIDGPELPILDGSALPFVRALLRAQLRAQGAPRRYVKVLKRVEVSIGRKTAALEPARAGEFDVTIRFDDPAIGTQRRHIVLDRSVFLDDIADARTFGFLADVQKLRAAGLGLGASLDNTIAVDEGRVINPEGLRHGDEFVRHKILDAIGDLALAGGPVLGRFIGDQPGHALNTKLVQALKADPEAWCWHENADTMARAAG